MYRRLFGVAGAVFLATAAQADAATDLRFDAGDGAVLEFAPGFADPTAYRSQGLLITATKDGDTASFDVSAGELNAQAGSVVSLRLDDAIFGPKDRFALTVVWRRSTADFFVGPTLFSPLENVGATGGALAPLSFPQPVFHSGAFTFTSAAAFSLDDMTVEIRPYVPEPATWALMIAGFGLAGTALRRRREAVA